MGVPLPLVVVDVAVVDVALVVAEDELILLVVLAVVLVVKTVVVAVVVVVVALLVVLVEPPQVTEKLVPSVERGDGCASVVPELDTIVISCTEGPKELIEPVTPLTVA